MRDALLDYAQDMRRISGRRNLSTAMHVGRRGGMCDAKRSAVTGACHGGTPLIYQLHIIYTYYEELASPGA